jgi:nucleotide-binding universal stress UspA family protein
MAMTPPASIVVGADASEGADTALTWAVRDAGTRNVPVRVVCAYRWPAESERRSYFAPLPELDRAEYQQAARAVVDRAVDRAHELDPAVTVHGEAVDGPPVTVLLEESAAGVLLVLGSRHRGAVSSTLLGSVSAAVAARSDNTVVVVGGPEALPHEAAVVVGVDGSESSEELLAFAFDQASRHRVPLQALLFWHTDPLSVMLWRSEPPVPERARVWLSEVLAGWGEKYPDVTVRSAVVRDHPGAGLTEWSSSAQLLVVGTRGRPALAGTLLGSVSQTVLHHSRCPVAVVPIRG